MCYGALILEEFTDHSDSADARKLAEKLKKKTGGKLIGLTTNLVDEVWGKDRPSRTNEKARVLDLKFTGKKFQEKIEDLRKELEKKKSAGLIICSSSSGLVLGYGLR